MNFINHSGHCSLDSGDALDCISAGIETITAALATLRADCELSKTSDETFAATIAALEDWKTAAQALLDCTKDEGGDDGYPGDDNCTGSGP